MGAAPKRRKLEKSTIDIEKQSPFNVKNQCCRCGMYYGKREGNFTVSHSPMYRGTGYLPICNNCLQAMYAHYLDQLRDEREAVRRICMKIDIYWNAKLYESAIKAAGSRDRLRNYISKTNLVRFIDKTFDNTIMEELAESDKATAFAYSDEDMMDAGFAKEEPEVAEDIPPEYIEFWGAGYTLSFYRDLEREFAKWTNGVTLTTQSERTLYKNICLLQVTIDKDSASGRPIDKNLSMLNTLLGSLNLKPTQRKDDLDASVENRPFGVWIKLWEDQRPVPEPDDKLKDVDGIIRYISSWFYGHLAKMLGVKGARSKAYEEDLKQYSVKRPEFGDDEMYDSLSDTQDGDSS